MIFRNHINTLICSRNSILLHTPVRFLLRSCWGSLRSSPSSSFWTKQREQLQHHASSLGLFVGVVLCSCLTRGCVAPVGRCPAASSPASHCCAAALHESSRTSRSCAGRRYHPVPTTYDQLTQHQTNMRNKPVMGQVWVSSLFCSAGLQ